MPGVGRVRADLARRDWPVAGARTRVLAYFLAVELVAVACMAWALTTLSAEAEVWLKMCLLVGLAIVFEEGTRRSARLQLRISDELKHDMTSVWSFAAAIALPPAMAVIVLGVVLTYTWFRQQRPAGEALYRKLFNTANAMLGCLAASAVMQAGSQGWAALPLGLAEWLPVLAAMLAYSILNRVLVTGGLLGMGVRGHALIGSRDDNLIEFATFCLGGLVALAVVYQPWLAILALVPMVSLQRGALVRELEFAATIDSKTGLFNAVAWERVAQRELARAIREGTSLAVLLIDIDRFKLVNDRYGHLIGDAVLRGVGRCLDAEVREYDSVGRFGGEEFVAVLPAAGDADALVVAERLRSRINALHVSQFDAHIAADDHTVLAVSIGVACTPADGTELPDLLHAADGALYRAKAAGRNRVLLAGRGEGSAPDRLSLS